MESTRNNGDDASKGDESKQESITIGDVAAAGLAIAGLVIAGGIAWAFGSSGDRKTMKAPGRDHRMYRDDFQRDPSDYFRNLRKK
ncbi:hypothetical protein CDL15_Pgr006381 [Punica granatum]|uniref:Uncharacterized protein n=1 Tax=Punica granatum TaxID=22663 RepID=A0A218VVH1_PUNGR|nr:hypothetical protein CDL15_Pgr006381 [Punica granatum]PKI42133.1 hypothetical protein CRG98_037475 [Punica granatum]